MAKKQRKDKRRNSLSIEKDRYYDNNIYNTDLDQENNVNHLLED